MTSNSKLRTDRKHIKQRKKKNYFPKIIVENANSDKPVLKKNNDHTRIMCKMQFCSSFNTTHRYQKSYSPYYPENG